MSEFNQIDKSEFVSNIKNRKTIRLRLDQGIGNVFLAIIVADCLSSLKSDNLAVKYDESSDTIYEKSPSDGECLSGDGVNREYYNYKGDYLMIFHYNLGDDGEKKDAYISAYHVE